MAASSSSSGGAGGNFRIGLYSSPVAGNNLVAYVDVPVPLPALIQYGGNYYVYSSYIGSRYVQVTPFVPNPDLGAPVLSVLAFPEF